MKPHIGDHATGVAFICCFKKWESSGIVLMCYRLKVGADLKCGVPYCHLRRSRFWWWRVASQWFTRSFYLFSRPTWEDNPNQIITCRLSLGGVEPTNQAVMRWNLPIWSSWQTVPHMKVTLPSNQIALWFSTWWARHYGLNCGHWGSKGRGTFIGSPWQDMSYSLASLLVSGIWPVSCRTSTSNP